MIIVRLKGGLGNQLFQYALGRKLSIKNRDELKLDATGYDYDELRHYALKDFKINATLATPNEINKLKYPHGLISKVWRYFSFKILRRFHVGYEEEILKKTGDFYLDGFWQSYKYFNDITETIKKEFALKKELSEEATLLIKKIETSNSASLHIRRGDYVNNNYHDLCSPQYYQKAINHLESKMSALTFFVFSDDIDWVKNNLKIKHPTEYVSNPKLSDSEELFLMSQCQNNIIANSSFSWWGAWLNNNPTKIVITPNRWVNSHGFKINDLIPPQWTKL